MEGLEQDSRIEHVSRYLSSDLGRAWQRLEPVDVFTIQWMIFAIDSVRVFWGVGLIQCPILNTGTFRSVDLPSNWLGKV